MEAFTFSKRKCCLLAICLFAVFTPKINCSNILFLFGGGNVSHKINIWPFVIGLADAGHNVTFTSSSDKVISTHHRVNDITPKAFLDYTKNLYINVNRIQARLDGETWDTNGHAFKQATLDFCKVQLKAFKHDDDFGSLFDKSKVDLVIINAAFNDCAFYLVHQLGVKFIIFSSSHSFPWHFGAFGVNAEVSVYPDFTVNGRFPPGFFERMYNLYRHYKGYTRASDFDEAMKQIVVEMMNPPLPPPSLVEIERNASLVFLNSHYSIDFARSLPPLFINIGGMQCWSEVGTLPKKFKDYMDEAENGVVLITFGSTIDFAKLDFKYTKIFLNMMAKFDKVRFIWKWDGPMPPDSPPNVMASNWLPQRQILDHPKILAFMTHGGLNSIMEATFHGVPLITFPLFADQDYNAYRVQAQELGILVDFRMFTQELLNRAVEEVLTNKMYKTNMMTRSKIFKDRSRTPTEEAVFWTDFAMRQDDTSALKPMLLEQSFFVRQLVDVYFGLFFVCLVLPLLLLYILNRVIKKSFVLAPKMKAT